MKIYIIIRFSQEYDNALEDYDNLYSLHTGTTNDIMVSSNKYANIKESIDTAVAAFIKRLIDEFGYAQYIGVNNMRNPDHGRPVNPFKIPLKRYSFTY